MSESFHWGNVWVETGLKVRGGRTINIAAEDQENEVQVWVSSGGRSIRVWKNGKEMREVEDD